MDNFTNTERENILNRIYLISERLVAFDGLDDIFSHILKTAIDITRAEAATIRVFNMDSGEIDIVKGFGLSEDFLSQPPLRVGEGIAGHVILHGEPYYCDDVLNDPLCSNRTLASIEGINSIMSVPLTAEKGIAGCISVYWKIHRNFSQKELLFLEIFGMQAAEAIEKTRIINELKKMATHDHLTGVYNKNSIISAAENMLLLSQRHSHEMSIIFIDVDDFKTFNDSNGHLLGDKLLCDMIRIFRNLCRKSDLIGRFGGEEFIIIAPHTGKHKAQLLADKLRMAVTDSKFTGKKDRAHGISFSAGVSTFPEDADDITGLLDKADRAMYISKSSGKNRVSVWKTVCRMAP